jgi:hypothetical protein
MSDEL